MLDSPAVVLDADAFVPASKRPFHIALVLLSACVAVIGALAWTYYQARQETHFECPPGREVRGGTPPIHERQWCVIAGVEDKDDILDGAFVHWHPTAFRYGKSGRLPLPMTTGFYSNGKKNGVFQTFRRRTPNDGPTLTEVYKNDVLISSEFHSAFRREVVKEHKRLLADPFSEVPKMEFIEAD